MSVVFNTMPEDAFTLAVTLVVSACLKSMKHLPGKNIVSNGDAAYRL